jgi:hypothetical protein
VCECMGENVCGCVRVCIRGHFFFLCTFSLVHLGACLLYVCVRARMFVRAHKPRVVVS